MGSHLTPFPCLAGINLVPILLPLWLFKVLVIGFRVLFPSLAHIHSADGHGARPPCQAAIGYKPLQNLSNCTTMLQSLLNGKKILQILPNGIKILQDFPGGGIVLRVSHSPPQIKNLAVLQGQKRVDGKSASEHNFTGVDCNFRVIQGNLPWSKKNPGVFRVFQGLLATLSVFA